MLNWLRRKAFEFSGYQVSGSLVNFNRFDGVTVNFSDLAVRAAPGSYLVLTSLDGSEAHARGGSIYLGNGDDWRWRFTGHTITPSPKESV